MNDLSEYFQEDIPSKRLYILNKIKQCQVLKLVRYSCIFPEELGKYTTSKDLLFRMTVGPLLMTLDSGLTVGFGIRPEKVSVSLWIEQTEKGERKQNQISIDEDPELFRIDCCDPIYGEPQICQILGQRIVKITMVKREKPNNSYFNRHAREAGLIFEFESGFELILSNGLDGAIGNFHIIYRHEVSPVDSEIIHEISI